MYILILIFISMHNGAPAISAIEFESQKKCQEAALALEKSKALNSDGLVYPTCVKK